METLDRVPDGLAHPSDLAVPTLVEDELQEARSELADPGRRRATVLEVDATSECFDHLRPWISLDLGDVRLLDAVSRMRETVRQRPIVREYEQSGRVEVEPADGNDAGVAADELDDRPPPTRIGDGRDDVPWLVEKDVPERLRENDLSVDLDPVAVRDGGMKPTPRAVHDHAAVLDELVGAATGGEPSAREIGVEAHPRHCCASDAHALQIRLGSHPVLDYADLTRRLADLIVGCGANVQPGQIVHVTTFLGNEDLTREVTRAAYQRGASWVDVLSTDLYVKRERLLHADPDTLEFVPQWLIDRLNWLADEGGARISLAGLSQPDALDGVDPALAGRDLLPYVPNLGEVINRNTTLWCVAPCPTLAWAKVVYPELPETEAYDKLWQVIAHMCRLDEPDPAAAWQTRSDQLKAIAGRLTDRRFDAIRLHGPGTDVTVGLLPSSRWLAGGHTRRDGLPYMANLPTEEMFTSPDPLRVDGHVTSTRPLEVFGARIDGIRVEFSGGRAVRLDAEVGGDALRGIAATDDGASRLGELALVDGEGRIGPLGTTFHVTLLDENAASHIALGSAYEVGVESDEDKRRTNRSKIHVDFMIGSPELDVDGLDANGSAVPLLRNGAWQI